MNRAELNNNLRWARRELKDAVEWAENLRKFIEATERLLKSDLINPQKSS